MAIDLLRLQLCHASRAFRHTAPNSDHALSLSTRVSRSVHKPEIATVPAAQAAAEVEWSRLHRKQVWDESAVLEWATVADDARKAGVEANL